MIRALCLNANGVLIDLQVQPTGLLPSIEYGLLDICLLEVACKGMRSV